MAYFYTQNDLFAGYRACRCKDGSYRLDRFERCYPCLDYGVTCSNESLVLDPGSYWQWISESEKNYYMNFTNNLQIFDGNYDKNLVTFNGSFPKPYQCPRKLSCRGGMDADCVEGYTGPLCAVCNDGHYKLVDTCFKCPALHWLIFQICALLLVVIVILIIVIKVKHRKTGSERSLSDIILARVKIIVSFYQISSGTLDAFSYVQWPSALIKLSEYSRFVQLNIFQIAPLHCFNSSLKMNAYDQLVITCSLTVFVILAALLYYKLKGLYLNMSSTRLSKVNINSSLEETKEACYRNVFLFVFVTYPQTCSTIFQILPPACHKVCQDINETKCIFYLKADYSIQCFTEKYNRYVILAYLALIYPLAVPILTVAVLWKYHFKLTQINNVKNDGLDDEPDQMELDQLGGSTKNVLDQTTCDAQLMKVNVKDSQSISNMLPTRNDNIETRHLEVISEEQDEPNPSQTQVNVLKEPPSSVSGSKVDVLSSRSSKQTSPVFLSKAANAVFTMKQVLGKSNAEDRMDRRRSVRVVVAPIPVVAALGFIYENYTEDCWFWETIEITRKLLLTSSLALIGAEGRTSLGVASVLSGVYAMIYAQYKPIPDRFEHVLQLTSLLVTFANTCIGMMLKIDQTKILDDDAKIMDSIIISVLLVTANVMVTVLVVVKFFVAIGRSIYSVVKNPRCSLACCISIMLTVNEVQSEARNMDGNSGLKMKKQLQRGNEFDGTRENNTFKGPVDWLVYLF
ncbi:hypothetical protein QZH41_010254 [Actinostola sp. cb2023]|nr:hypothetical protein QZH41_010254 [Actinostola sp. cb2023]